MGFVEEGCVVFINFYDHIKLSRCLTSSFLTLIPKSQNPQKVIDFHQISHIGCVYKIITELLARGLSGTLNYIHRTQSVFIPKKEILDVVIINKVVDSGKKSGKKCAVLAVDFENAFDLID